MATTLASKNLNLNEHNRGLAQHTTATVQTTPHRWAVSYGSATGTIFHKTSQDIAALLIIAAAYPYNSVVASFHLRNAATKQLYHPNQLSPQLASPAMRLSSALLLLVSATAGSAQRTLFDAATMDRLIEEETKRMTINGIAVESAEEVEAEVDAIVAMYEEEEGEETTNDDFNFEAEYNVDGIDFFADAQEEAAPAMTTTHSGKAVKKMAKNDV